jgi:CPA1 family monovalent cation:H+ antiporter
MIAAIGLPLLLRNLRLPADQGVEAERARARRAGAKAAIAELERVQHRMADGRDDADRFVDVAGRLMDQYRERLDALADDDDSKIAAKADERLEREMRLAAIRAERRAIFNLAHRREITTGVAEQLGRELDLVDARLTRFGTSA